MDDLVKRLREATDGVAEGPWRVEGEEGNLGMYDGLDGPMMFQDEMNHSQVLIMEREWRFIAAARQLVPEAAAALEAKDAGIARVLDAFEEALAIPYWGDNQEDHMRLYDIHDAARAALQAKE